MIDAQQLREYIVRPALRKCGLYSLSAENLLMGTCAVESDMASFIVQQSGPALSPWQIEPNTHKDIYLNFLSYNSIIRENILAASHYAARPPDEALIANLTYSCLIARLVYYRDKDPLPAEDDILGLAHYWKRVYNTEDGMGTVKDFVEKYNKYVLCETS